MGFAHQRVICNGYFQPVENRQSGANDVFLAQMDLTDAHQIDEFDFLIGQHRQTFAYFAGPALRLALGFFPAAARLGPFRHELPSFEVERGQEALERLELTLLAAQ